MVSIVMHQSILSESILWPGKDLGNSTADHELQRRVIRPSPQWWGSRITPMLYVALNAASYSYLRIRYTWIAQTILFKGVLG
jgi:hypothetical protein